jgi:hypothetical protein
MIKVELGTENPPLQTIKKHYNIFVMVYKLLDTVHTDQTRAFMITSQQGFWYIMVGIHLDANYIFCKLMKNKTKGDMITAYQRIVDRMKLLALGLKHHQLDNKCSEKFKECIAKNGMTHELGLPDCHHCNIAKQAIQMFKNHFVSILSGVNETISPLPLVPSSATSGTHHQSTTTEQPHTKSVCVCPCPWATQLHETPVCTPGMGGDGPRQTQEPTNLGCLHRHQLQHWDSNGASPMIPHLHCENKGNKS